MGRTVSLFIRFLLGGDKQFHSSLGFCWAVPGLFTRNKKTIIRKLVQFSQAEMYLHSHHKSELSLSGPGSSLRAIALEQTMRDL